MKMNDQIAGGRGKVTRREVIRGLGGIAGLSFFGMLGCSHKKKKPVEIIPKPQPIVLIKYKDRNLNGRFDPWIDDRIEEHWFFHEGSNMVIYLIPENVTTGDELEYSIYGPDRKMILKKKISLNDGQRYAAIDGHGTNMTEYLVREGGYGTFRVDAYLNGKALMTGGKEFKISPKPQ